ncbi:MAG: hypothetical protein Q4G33_12250 [bacterium]|nr:hypothetical protein [bacterium]
MIQNYEQHITYICPSCGRAVTRIISPFMFSGRKAIAVLCPVCMLPCFTLSNAGKSYRMDIQCIICGETHCIGFRKPDLWNKPLLTAKCENTDVDYCFIGDADKIRSAFEKAKNDIAELQLEEEEYFDDYIPADGDEAVGALIAAICESLHILSEDNSLSCRCGNKKIHITVIDDNIFIRCNSCGSTKLFKPTDDFLDELYQAESFIFNKK